MVNLVCHFNRHHRLLGIYKFAAITCLILGCITPSIASAQQYITNGIGEYKEFNEAVLLVKLELENPASDAIEVMAVDSNKKLSFRVMKQRSPRSWSKIWIQNLSINNSPDTLSSQTDDLIAMTQSFKGSLRAGDQVTFERIANDLTILSINEQEITDFETPGFFEFLLSAFIGSVPPSGELKASLMAGEVKDADLMSAFDSLNYTADRASEVAAWGVAATAPVVAAAETVVEEPAATTEPEQPEAAETESTAGESTEELQEAGEQIDTPTEVVETAGDQPVELTDTDASAEESLAEPEAVEEEAPIVITAESLLAAQNYQRSVLMDVYRKLEYPRNAIRRNREGSVRVSIGIGQEGDLASLNIVQNARYSEFDEAAIEAIEDAAPFEPLPEGTIEVPMLLEIPIAFRLQ